MKTIIEDCRLGVKRMALDSCHKRQLSKKRWVKTRYNSNQTVINEAFMSCVRCRHWLSDEEYNKKYIRRQDF